MFAAFFRLTGWIATGIIRNERESFDSLIFPLPGFALKRNENVSFSNFRLS